MQVDITIVQPHIIETSDMGKKYKYPTDNNDFDDDLFNDELEVDQHFDWDLNLYMEKQASGNSRRGKAARGRTKTPDYYDNPKRHRLPRDWQDFDYYPDSQLHDDWH